MTATRWNAYADRQEEFDAAERLAREAFDAAWAPARKAHEAVYREAKAVFDAAIAASWEKAEVTRRPAAEVLAASLRVAQEAYNAAKPDLRVGWLQKMLKRFSGRLPAKAAKEKQP